MRDGNKCQFCPKELEGKIGVDCAFSYADLPGFDKDPKYPHGRFLVVVCLDCKAKKIKSLPASQK